MTTVLATTPILSLLASIASAGVGIIVSHNNNVVTLTSTGDKAYQWLLDAAGDDAEASEWYGSGPLAPGWNRVQQTIRITVDGYTFMAHRDKAVPVQS